jgi:hypothetical protein
MPLVTVIIAARDACETLPSTLRSVLHQTLEDIEVIVVDDGSTDETAAIAHGTGDRRVVVQSIAPRGASAARNLGFSLARSRYVTFLDADDLWTTDKLRSQQQALSRHESATVAYSWTILIDSEGRYLFAKRPSQYEGNVHRDLLMDFFLGSGSNLMLDRQRMKTEILHDESLTVAEDWDFQLRLARDHEFVCVPAYQVLYRLVPGSRSDQPGEIEQTMSQIAAREIEFVRDPTGVAAHTACGIHDYIALQNLVRPKEPPKLRPAAGHWAMASLAPHRLIQPRTYGMLCTLVGLSLVPAKRRGDALRRLLRFYGKLSNRAARLAYAKFAEGI